MILKFEKTDTIQSIWVNLSAFIYLVFKVTFVAVKSNFAIIYFCIQETFSCRGAEIFSILLSYNLYTKNLECLMCMI